MIACTAIARVAVVIALVGVLGISQPAKDALPPCVRVMIALEDDIDSAHARPDDAFRFVTVDDARLRDGTSVPAGSIGHGIVAISQHAERGGRGGYLVLDARFVALASGPHIPAAIDWSLATRATATGASMNIPGIVGAIPFAGYFLGPYGFIHHGKDVIIPRGAQLPVLLGDDVAAGLCRLVPPSPQPSPTPAVTVSPAAASSFPPSPSPSTVEPTPTALPASPVPSPTATI
jgi:hypothetical protein